MLMASWSTQVLYVSLICTWSIRHKLHTIINLSYRLSSCFFPLALKKNQYFIFSVIIFPQSGIFMYLALILSGVSWMKHMKDFFPHVLFCLRLLLDIPLSACFFPLFVHPVHNLFKSLPLFSLSTELIYHAGTETPETPLFSAS